MMTRQEFWEAAMLAAIPLFVGRVKDYLHHAAISADLALAERDKRFRGDLVNPPGAVHPTEAMGTKAIEDEKVGGW